MYCNPYHCGLNTTKNTLRTCILYHLFRLLLWNWYRSTIELCFFYHGDCTGKHQYKSV